MKQSLSRDYKSIFNVTGRQEGYELQERKSKVTAKELQSTATRHRLPHEYLLVLRIQTIILVIQTQCCNTDKSTANTDTVLQYRHSNAIQTIVLLIQTQYCNTDTVL